MKKVLLLICVIILGCLVVALCACNEPEASEIIITEKTEINTTKTETTTEVSTETETKMVVTTDVSSESVTEETTLITETTETSKETTTALYIVEKVDYYNMQLDVYADDYDENSKTNLPYPVPVYIGSFNYSTFKAEEMNGIGYLFQQGEKSVLIGKEDYSIIKNAHELKAKEKITCIVDDYTVTGECIIYDMSGNFVKRMIDKNGVYDISSLPQGEYILIIECVHKKHDFFLSNGEKVSVYDFDLMTFILYN